MGSTLEQRSRQTKTDGHTRRDWLPKLSMSMDLVSDDHWSSQMASYHETWSSQVYMVVIRNFHLTSQLPVDLKRSPSSSARKLWWLQCHNVVMLFNMQQRRLFGGSWISLGWTHGYRYKRPHSYTPPATNMTMDNHDFSWDLQMVGFPLSC